MFLFVNSKDARLLARQLRARQASVFFFKPYLDVGIQISFPPPKLPKLHVSVFVFYFPVFAKTFRVCKTQSDKVIKRLFALSFGSAVKDYRRAVALSHIRGVRQAAPCFAHNMVFFKSLILFLYFAAFDCAVKLRVFLLKRHYIDFAYLRPWKG